MGLFETIGSVPIQEYALGLVIIAAWNLLVMWPDKPVIKHHVAFFDAEGYASTHNPQNAAGESTQNPKPTAVEEYRHALFPIGQLVATPGALEACDEPYLTECVDRHMRGDWGVVCYEDKATNDEALKDGSRILSAYPIDPSQPCKGYGDNCLWIITEADRSVTTALLPSEY